MWSSFNNNFIKSQTYNQYYIIDLFLAHKNNKCGKSVEITHSKKDSIGLVEFHVKTDCQERFEVKMFG